MVILEILNAFFKTRKLFFLFSIAIENEQPFEEVETDNVDRGKIENEKPLINSIKTFQSEGKYIRYKSKNH